MVPCILMERKTVPFSMDSETIYILMCYNLFFNFPFDTKDDSNYCFQSYANNLIFTVLRNGKKQLFP